MPGRLGCNDAPRMNQADRTTFEVHASVDSQRTSEHGRVHSNALAPVVGLAGVALLLGVSVGCSKGIDRVKVAGQVLIDGEPLTVGFIRVYPEGARDSSSKLDSEGRFDLRTYKPGDGIPLGTHVVTVNGSEWLNATRKKWHSPPKYARVATSSLSIDVTGPTEDVVIELTWGGGKPFVEVIK